MNNFARLLRHAWPYRLRFALSIACAGMVALFWGGNIGAVYPLLQILIRSENCQTWIAEQIRTTETEGRALSARIEELDAFGDMKAPIDALKARKAHAAEVYDRAFQAVRELREVEARTAGKPVATVDAGLVGEMARKKAPDGPRDRDLQVAKARYDETAFDLEAAQRGGFSELEYRESRLRKEFDKASWWNDLYRRAEPFVVKYLPNNGFRTMVLLLGVVMVGIALKGIFLFFQEVLVSDMTQLTLFDVRNLFYRRTMALDLASFNDQGSAELIARFTNDMESLNQGFMTVLGRVIREPLRIVSCLGAALWLNWRLTCLALVLVPVSAACTARAGKIMKRAVRRSLESMSNIYKILQESLQGIKVVKAYTMERYERRRFFMETKSLYKKSVKVAMIDAMSDPVLEMLALTTVSIALLSGSYLVLYHTRSINFGLFELQLASKPLEIEDLLTFYAMLAGISDPVRKLANVHTKIQRASAAADRICALMDRAPSVASKPGAVRLHRHKAQIEFDDVSFGYNDRETVLKGFTLEVKHGETIALVGPNGCGKSTLMNLIPRFWDVKSGAIRIDGVDVRDVQVRSLRSQVGMVIQETTLFNDTVANNIAYGNRHAKIDDIVRAAERSYAHSFIMNLPDGYQTVLGEAGVGLSGGQRQRLALARAMLRDPSILILDEATSAVDIQDEALIRKAVEEFSRDRTTFVITHSLAGLSFADRIVLIDDGRIEAVGTEAELRRTSSLFRKLHEIQYHRESA